MLVIKLEIWPWGQEAAARELGRCVIANTTKGPSVELGDYEAEFSGSDAHFSLMPPVSTRDWPRLDKSPWELLHKVIGLAIAKQKRNQVKAVMAQCNSSESEVA